MVVFGMVRLGALILGMLTLDREIDGIEAVGAGNVGVGMPVILKVGNAEVCTVRRDDGAGWISVGKLGPGIRGPRGVGRKLEMSGLDGVGTSSEGVKVGALMLMLGVERENPSDGTLTEGKLNDGSPTVGCEMLRLEEGIVRDGVASDGIGSDGPLRDGALIVGSEMLRLGDGSVRDGKINDGILDDGTPIVGSETLRLGYGVVRDGNANDSTLKVGKPMLDSDVSRLGDGTATENTLTYGALSSGTLSTLTEGIARSGGSVGVAGKLIMGRPNESTGGGSVGSISMLGDGMINDGGPVIEGISIEDNVTEGRDVSGIVSDGRLIETGLPDGMVTGGTLADGSANVSGLAGGVSNDGCVNVTLGDVIVKEVAPIVDKVADTTPIELRLPEGTPCAGIVGLKGTTLVHVVDGATNVTSVLGGMSTDGITPDVKLIEPIPADETLTTVAELADGTFAPTSTSGTLTGATVGTVTAT